MADRRPHNTRVDADGVRTTRTSGIGAGVWAALAVAAALCAALLWWAPRSPPAADDRPFREQREARPPAPRAAGQGARVVQLPPRRSLPDEARPGDGAPVLPADAAAADDAAAAPSEYGDGAVGIGAFPPPGTDPLKRGIVVPENFELPEGYVRHYQTTDDGKPLRAILMFHPDYQPVDADGDPIAVPEDRVVPPELAPPGLEVEILDDPEPEIPYIEEGPAE